jgi:hypothetical protein
MPFFFMVGSDYRHNPGKFPFNIVGLSRTILGLLTFPADEYFFGRLMGRRVSHRLDL